MLPPIPIHSQPLPSTLVYSHLLTPTLIHSHPHPSTPNHFHSLLTHSHSLSNHSYQLWLISSPHLPTHTHFLRVLRICRIYTTIRIYSIYIYTYLYALLRLTYLINLRGVILNRAIAVVLSNLSAFYVFFKGFTYNYFKHIKGSHFLKCITSIL